MELTEALNYMKNIIDNGKQRHSKSVNIKKGLLEYLKALVIEGAINNHDYAVLKGIIKRTDAIVNSSMTVDEAFVRSLCAVEKVEYTSLKSEKGQVVQLEPEKNIEKKPRDNNKVVKTPKSKPKKESYKPCTPPAPPFEYKPTGSCGRIEEALKKAAYEEWEEKYYGHDDGIWGKCRH